MNRPIRLCICLIALSPLSVPLVLSQTPGSPEVVVLENARIQLTDLRQLAGSQSGVLLEVRVKEGDLVKRGDILAVLDDRVPSAALTIAAKEAENDIDVRFARKAAEVAEAEYRQALAANEIETSTFSEIQIEKLRLETERSNLQIDVAEHKLEIARLRKAEAATLVETYRVLAPIDGVVSRASRGAGEAVAAGEDILEIKSTNTVKVEADLPLEYHGSVQVGAHVSVSQNLGARKSANRASVSKGRIFFVDVSADPVTKSVRILAEVENNDGSLIAGLPATLSIETGAK